MIGRMSQGGISDSGIVVATARTERAVAVDVVREFIDALSRRDLVAAGARIAMGLQITAAGGRRFRRLEEFVAYSGSRNGAVRKAVEILEACEAANGIAVFVRGTMSGEWLDGTPFTDVRFIDRLLVVEGRIAELEIWSDLAEFRPLRG
jgi:hypothetical protein